MRDLPLSFFDALELRVTLRHIEPAVWRELRVPARLSLAQLHDVLGAIAEMASTFLYRYDFGDDWEHDVIVKGVVSTGERDIICTAGARACPPEDSGGPPGYSQLLGTLSDPDHEEYADVKRWVGRRFDPERFDLQAVNKKLTTLAKRFAPRFER